MHSLKNSLIREHRVHSYSYLCQIWDSHRDDQEHRCLRY